MIRIVCYENRILREVLIHIRVIFMNVRIFIEILANKDMVFL